MIESADKTRQLLEQAQATDQTYGEWQDLYYAAIYLRGRGDDPFADSVWEELESAHEGEISLPPQVVRRLRVQLEQKLRTQWQTLYDDGIMLKEAGHDPFSEHGWEELATAKDARNLDSLALTVHYLQPSLERTRNEVIQELTQVARELKDKGNDPLSPEEWDRLLAAKRTPEEDKALIQMLMPRVIDTLYTLLQKLNLTAQQFHAAGYAPFISNWERLQQAIERRSLREMIIAIHIFPGELEEHIRLRIPYWSDKATRMEEIREQLKIQSNRNQAADLLATYDAGLTKLKSLDRKDNYSLNRLHPMVLAISEVESSWKNLVALSRSEERLVKRLRWVTGGIVLAFLALIVAAMALAPRRLSVNEPTPLLGIPPSVILWSFIGSFVALLMRFIQRKFWEIDDFVKWFLTRSLVGLIMGAVLYLVVVSGFFAFGIIIGAPSSTLSTLPRPEIFWLLAFVGAANDKIAERILSAVTSSSIKLFESINESMNKATDEPKTGEEKTKKGKTQDV
jgi:hypothetical protein